MRKDAWYAFVLESNAIEGIYREPTPEEIDELQRFTQQDFITIEDMEKFISVYQPDAVLRDEFGRDVQIGHYVPPMGCPEIRQELDQILVMYRDADRCMASYYTHIAFEKLHPFTDCNGRLGRALWAHIYKDISMGFLKRFYFQTLEYSEFQ